MCKKIFKTGALLLFVGTLSLSCLSDKKDNDSIWIKQLRIRHKYVPNPDAVVFIIHSNNEMKDVLLSEKWDSIKFSGGFFDTINYFNITDTFYRNVLGIAETENQDELIIGMTGNFSMFTEEQTDSIVSLTFKEVEINIYSKNKHWTLKPLEEKDDILFFSHLSEKMYDNIWIEEFRITYMLYERPPSVFFTVHTNSYLKELLLAEQWDSVKFSGGVFDTVNFNKRFIDIEKLENVENQDKLILRITTDRFYTLTKEDVDSIVSRTFKELDIDIYYKDYHWTLKPR